MREIHVIKSAELGRDVEVQVILPKGYKDEQERYPVLYFYDGNRIYDTPELKNKSALHGSFEFGDYSSAYWKFLPKVILVGITPPDDMWKRTAEYTPYSKKFDVPEGVSFEPEIHGKGKLLGKWLVNCLRPWVNDNYRTRPEALYTAIGGLSTSGVNALYMAATYTDVFSRVLVHAPAVHLWMDAILPTITDADFSHLKYLYVDIGTDDCTRMVKNGYAYRDIKQILGILLERGLKKEALRFFEIHRGIHDCASWRLTFPDGLRWIFQDL